MSTTYEYTYSGAAYVNPAFPNRRYAYNESGTLISVMSASYYELLLIRFPEIPSSLLYKKLISAKLQFEARQNKAETGFLYIFSMASDINPATVTWATMPQISNEDYGYRFFTSVATSYAEGVLPDTYRSNGGTTSDPVQIANASKSILTSNSVAIKPSFNTDIWIKGAPVLIIEIDENVTINSQVTPYNTPTSGWINPVRPNTFAWKYLQTGDYPCLGDFQQASAVFHWRSGTSGSWTDIPVSGTTQSVTIPANTFPGGTIQWYVSGTDSAGTNSQTDVFTLTTTDSASVATPIEPIGTVEDGSAPIVFKFTVANDTGALQTGADLQKSTDGSNWSTFAQISGTGTEYSAPANTFAAGRNYWRVRSYNRDGVAGPWSSSVQFVSVAAPAAPSVSCDAKPFATVSWQSSGQQVYEITVDRKVYGPYFGTAKNFVLPDYLPDGQHTVSVRVQGTYGLWSDPGSVTFTVANVPGDPVTLHGAFGRDAVLTWTTESEAENYYIYRDDVRIGHKTSLDFVDRFVLGRHDYFVINKLPGGYYTKSNYVSGILRSCVRAVSAFAGGGWLEMALSDDSDTEENFSWTMTANERHVTGAAWPVVERSPYTDGSGSYRISFADVESGAAFEALRGQRIIVKSRGGNVVIGVMTGYQKTMTNFYLTYVFTVRRCDWRDYVDAGD